MFPVKIQIAGTLAQIRSSAIHSPDTAMLSRDVQMCLLCAYCVLDTGTNSNTRNVEEYFHTQVMSIGFAFSLKAPITL